MIFLYGAQPAAKRKQRDDEDDGAKASPAKKNVKVFIISYYKFDIISLLFVVDRQRKGRILPTVVLVVVDLRRCAAATTILAAVPLPKIDWRPIIGFALV